MRTSDLHYELPPELIAQHPAQRRDASRLLVLERPGDRLTHTRFLHLPDYLQAGDCLVVNETQVLPARFFATRQTGASVEGLYLRTDEGGCWRVLLKSSRRLRADETLLLTGGPWRLTLTQKLEKGQWLVRPDSDLPADELLARIGQTPLPPYIKRAKGDPTDAQDRQRYQTVYAARPGAVAAPTAGLHFTDELLAQLQTKGVGLARVTLHVGLGTFEPIAADHLEHHHMHAERYDLPAESAECINRSRQRGGHIVCVGTTSVRVLETCADDGGTVRPRRGQTDLYIYPPYRFKAVDMLLTNFHLPRSTLLALVFAFAGRRQSLNAYHQAIAKRYRFYSYGDAMLIL
jgi:S-adenosylmethionine:tRNA ribosyltransferase-isomerase